MAKLKIVDQARAETLYNDLFCGMGGRSDVRVGHNTRLAICEATGCIYLRLYHTEIVEVTPDNIVSYDAGGWLTQTTVSRMNNVARLFGSSLSRAGGKLTLLQTRKG